jgi:hypothetical protein
MVKRKSGRNSIADEPLSVAEELYAKAFDTAPRSHEYKVGVIVALLHRSAGIEVRKHCPYKAGTVEYDAFHAGLGEGYRIWRAR